MPRKRNNSGRFAKTETIFVKRCYMVDAEDDVLIRQLIKPGECISEVVRDAIRFYLKANGVAKPKETPTSVITVIGYAALVDEYPTESAIKKKEARCKNRCRMLGISYSKTYDPVLGEIGEYPIDVVKGIW